MKPIHLLLALSLVTPALHAASDDELQRLKDENARLKAQIESMKQQQQGLGSGSSAGNTVTAPAGKASATRAPISPGAQTLNGVDLSESGCSHGGLDYGADAAWKDQPNWDSLRKGMSTKEVEQWLGKMHFNVQSKDRLMWQFGKCGDTVQGYTVFEGDSLVYWKTPDF